MASILQVGLLLGTILAAEEVSHPQPRALQVPVHTPGETCQAATQNQRIVTSFGQVSPLGSFSQGLQWPLLSYLSSGTLHGLLLFLPQVHRRFRELEGLAHGHEGGKSVTGIESSC